MLRLDSGLSSGQVLQRNASGKASVTLALSGDARGPVTVTITTDKGKDLKGLAGRRVGSKTKSKASVTLKGIPTGGPYRLEISCGESTATVAPFFVGDVWVLAGQSNMQGCGNMDGAAPRHPLIRALSMRREWRPAAEPLHLTSESPDACHYGGQQLDKAKAERQRKLATKGVGPGLFFAHERLASTGVPQALIATSHGGTSMKQWTPRRLLDGQIGLYGSALDSVRSTGQPVAGVLWYQGESDTSPAQAEVYTQAMRTLVRNFRRDLRQPKLPWVIVQIGRVFGDRTPTAQAAWNSVQDQQRLLPKVIPNLGVVAAIDLSLDDNIHISAQGQAVLGQRLAREMDRLTGVRKREPAPPALKRVSQPHSWKPKARNAPGSVIAEVEFENVVGGLRSEGLASGFSLLDPQGNDIFGVYKVILDGNIARVHLGQARPDALLAYGHGTMPVCNITDGRGHAVPVFAPQTMGQPLALLPYLVEWVTHEPVRLETPLDKLATPPRDLPAGTVRSYEDNEFKLPGFVNEHPNWQGHGGIAFFTSVLTLPEAMRLQMRLGYDGPIRVWVDDKPVFTDMGGTNPCLPDQSRTVVAMAKGKRRITVGIDINEGAAWGFILGLCRKDVTKREIADDNYAKPTIAAK